MVSFTLFAYQALAFALAIEGHFISVAGTKQDLKYNKLSERESSGFLKLDFGVTRKVLPKTNSTLGRKRDEPTSSLSNHKVFYTIDLNFGSQAQTISVDLDTGSSDLWVNDKSSGSEAGFDSKASSSYKNTGKPFQISYVDGSQSSGEWVTDNVGIPGGPTLENFQFADVTSTSTQSINGILGINSEKGESNANYPNFPVALKNAGHINKVAYSIYLNELDATSGTIIFGGIDISKYDGSLVKLPLTQSTSIAVTLDSVVTADGKSVDAKADAILDTGTTLTYLPENIVSEIAQGLAGAQYNSNSGDISLSSCEVPEDKVISYNFGNATIKVPLKELIFQESGTSCTLGIQSNSQTQGINLLGDTFLRSAYLVVNFDDNVAELAQVRYTNESSIETI